MSKQSFKYLQTHISYTPFVARTTPPYPPTTPIRKPSNHLDRLTTTILPNSTPFPFRFVKMRPLKGVTTKIYRIYGLVILSFLGLLTPCSKVQAQTNEHTLDTFQPRYELGVGAVRLNLPKYPGSKKTTVRNIFFPWIIYRGEYLRIDDEGQRTSH